MLRPFPKLSAITCIENCNLLSVCLIQLTKLMQQHVVFLESGQANLLKDTSQAVDDISMTAQTSLKAQTKSAKAERTQSATAYVVQTNSSTSSSQKNKSSNGNSSNIGRSGNGRRPRCHFCNRLGHIKSECRTYKKYLQLKQQGVPISF